MGMSVMNAKQFGKGNDKGKMKGESAKGGKNPLAPYMNKGKKKAAKK